MLASTNDGRYDDSAQARRDNWADYDTVHLGSVERKVKSQELENLRKARSGRKDALTKNRQLEDGFNRSEAAF